MDHPRPPFGTNVDSHFESNIRIDWPKVERVGDVRFAADIREAIENELNLHSQRLEKYARNVDEVVYRKALEALAATVSTPGAQERMLPVEHELHKVAWFLELMARPLSPRLQMLNDNYLLYSTLWSIIERTGVRMSMRKGTENKLSVAQRIFQEICAQASIRFNGSDEALAQPLKRALEASKPVGSKSI